MSEYSKYDLKVLARVHAHLCGDGGLYVYKTSENDRIYRAEICYCNTNVDLINSFREDMYTLFGVKMYYYKKNKIIRIKSIRLAKIFLNLSKYAAREWSVPELIKTADEEVKLEWIKSFSHDEGYLPKNRNIIRIKSVNYDGLKDVKWLLDSMEIYSRLTGPNCDNTWYLNIRKEKGLNDFYKKPSRK